MRLADLPAGTPVAIDTEDSGLHSDDWDKHPPEGARVAVVSLAYRDPETGTVRSQAIPFDQGVNELPLGPKEIPARHAKRLAKWPDWAREEVAPNRPAEDFQTLLKILWDNNLSLIYHSAKFDMAMLRAGLRGISGIDLQSLFYWDTQLVQHVVEPQMPTALKATAVRLMLTDAGSEDAEQKALAPWLGPKTGKNADPRFDLVPWTMMEPYARVDAELTLALYEHQMNNYNPEEDLGLFHHIGREFDLMKTLYRMEARGIGFDADRCTKSAEVLHAELDTLAERLPIKGGTGRPTPNAARKFFFTDAGRAPFKDKMTEGGQPKVDEEVIARLVKEGVPYAEMYERHEGVKSALSKWYDSWPRLVGRDGRLRTSHKQGTVVSGRLAVGRVQLQAIPHSYLLPDVEGIEPVRSLFQAKSDHELWEFDVSQAEIRVATAMAKCEPMLDGIRNGDDSHSIACKLMFGIEEDHPDWDRKRQVSKRCNLGILYGAGAKTIREQILKFTGIDYPLSQVKEWIDQWKAAFPEFDRALRDAARLAERLGFVVLYNGRERWFSDYEPTHKGFNQLVQGSLAEVMKDLMVQVDVRWPGELLLQIHDSLLLEVPEPKVRVRSEQVRELMVQGFESAFEQAWKPGGPKIRVPFKADAKAFS